jgi:hypothetical protein
MRDYGGDESLRCTHRWERGAAFPRDIHARHGSKAAVAQVCCLYEA